MKDHIEGKSEKFEDVRVTNVLEKREIPAPSSYVSVFHGTERSMLPFIAEHGLIAMAAGKYREDTDRILDENRPPECVEQSISRSSVYAEPRGSGPKQWGGEVNLELKVDPTLCFVVNSELAAEVGVRHERGHDDSAAEIAKKYWVERMTLKEFMENYHQPRVYSGEQAAEEAEEMKNEYSSTWVRNEDAPRDLPGSISFPEVIIPQNVPPELIRTENP